MLIHLYMTSDISLLNGLKYIYMYREVHVLRYT